MDLTRARIAAAALFALVLAATDAPRADDAPPRVLRVATSGDYAPFSSSAAPAGAAKDAFADDGSGLAGFDVEVARLFARERGYGLQFVHFRWPDLGRELAAGSFDVAMSGITVRAERAIAGRYSVPVAATHAVALTWKGSGARTVEDLDRPTRRLFVNAGGHLEKVADLVFRHAQVHAVADNDAVRMALLDRVCDAVVTDDFEQKVWTAGARDVVAIGPLSDDRKAYLLAAGRDDLAAELDRWLMAKEEDGTLARLRTSAFGDEGPGHAATAAPAAAFASAVTERQALMPMVWAAKRKAGKPVEDKAQEAVVLDSAIAALRAEAVAAGQPEPDANSARAVFEQLMSLGKDVQQALAERDAKRRPGTVHHRSGSGGPSPETTAAVRGHDGGAASQPEPARVPSATREYDLTSELRPALARITGKIARTMLAMKAGTPSSAWSGPLREQLKSGGARAEHVEALVDALSVWTSRRPYSGR